MRYRALSHMEITVAIHRANKKDNLRVGRRGGRLHPHRAAVPVYDVLTGVVVACRSVGAGAAET